MVALKPRRLFLLVEGIPRPLPRPRFVGRGPGEVGGGHAVSWRHDRHAVAWAALVEEASRRAKRKLGERWDPAARVTVELMFTLPVEAMGPAEPDWDNLAKLACDALQRAGVVKNDRQIVRAVVGKQFARDAARVGMAAVITADGQGVLELEPVGRGEVGPARGEVSAGGALRPRGGVL